jgi:ribosomal protein S18 acetylase RimI-like enzyme
MGLQPRATLREAVRTLRADGPMVFAQKSAAAFGLRCLLLLERDLTNTQMTGPGRVSCAFRTLDASTLTAYLATEPELGRADAEHNLAAGHACHLALVDGTAVASSWVSRDFIYSAWGRVRQPLAPDQAYIFGAHTAPAFRGRGINFALNCHLESELRKAGIRRAFRCVVPWNVPARAAHGKAGYVETGRFVSLGIGPLAGSRFFATHPTAASSSVR